MSRALITLAELALERQRAARRVLSPVAAATADTADAAKEQQPCVSC